jgi:hypothetical protein
MTRHPGPSTRSSPGRKRLIFNDSPAFPPLSRQITELANIATRLDQALGSEVAAREQLAANCDLRLQQMQAANRQAQEDLLQRVAAMIDSQAVDAGRALQASEARGTARTDDVRWVCTSGCGQAWETAGRHEIFIRLLPIPCVHSLSPRPGPATLQARCRVAAGLFHCLHRRAREGGGRGFGLPGGAPQRRSSGGCRCRGRHRLAC